MLPFFSEKFDQLPPANLLGPSFSLAKCCVASLSFPFLRDLFFRRGGREGRKKGEGGSGGEDEEGKGTAKTREIEIPGGTSSWACAPVGGRLDSAWVILLRMWNPAWLRLSQAQCRRSLFLGISSRSPPLLSSHFPLPFSLLNPPSLIPYP